MEGATWSNSKESAKVQQCNYYLRTYALTRNLLLACMSRPMTCEERYLQIRLSMTRDRWDSDITPTLHRRVMHSNISTTRIILPMILLHTLQNQIMRRKSSNQRRSLIQTRMRMLHIVRQRKMVRIISMRRQMRQKNIRSCISCAEHIDTSLDTADCVVGPVRRFCVFEIFKRRIFYLC